MNKLELLPFGYVASYIFVIGLCIGSFLNVVVLRGLSGEDMFFARSKCPKCENQLKWYMNIPLFSYLFLKGKCAFCKTKISFQYPLVEFITGCAFLASFIAFGLTFKALFACIFLSLFIVMSATDFIETVVLDYHTYILLGFGLLYSFLGLSDINILQAILSAGFGFLLFEVFARIGQIFTGCRMFGEGDSLIALGLGAIFGWKVLVLIFALSVLIQSVCAIPIMIFNAIKSKKIKLAFSYVLVFLAIFVMIINNFTSFINNETIYLYSVITITILLLWALKNIILEIKEKKNDDTKNEEEKYSLMPFGPALLIASTLCLFYLPQIKSFLLNFFN